MSLTTMPDTPPRLLVVDDNEVNRILLERMFQSDGYDTDTAEDGEQAIEKLRAASFDLVLMDIMMPIMDGLAALEYIRNHRDTAALPVILISAMSDTTDIVRGLEMGANDYITKPIDMDIALARVRTQVTLKQLVDERQDTIRRLEESQEMRERFFRIASHDLKNPINNLRMTQRMLAHTVSKDNAQAHELLTTMRTTLAAMNEVVQEFLDSAALQSGRVDINIRPVSVEAVVREVVSAQLYHAQEKGIAVNAYDLGGEMLCDPPRLSQVLSNLMSNAVKYSPRGSTVRVWATHRQEAVRIHVADEGAGIPESERANLFQAFGKLSNKPTAGESSHGLGLWIAKHLITLQDGDIGVECPPYGGSIFWVDVPCASDVS